MIRITISPEKEVVHLIMPEQDTESIIKLLLEEGRLDRPGRGFIYQTPVSYGLIDTRMRVGRQEYAASMEQIIAAIDQLKRNTFWRKRLDTVGADSAVDEQLWHPNDNCEISIISDEDAEKTNDVVDALLEHSAVGIKFSERLQVLDSPAAYIHSF